MIKAWEMFHTLKSADLVILIQSRGALFRVLASKVCLPEASPQLALKSWLDCYRLQDSTLHSWHGAMDGCGAAQISVWDRLLFSVIAD